MSTVHERKQAIERTIQEVCDRSERSRSDVQIVAVTKSVSSERTSEVVKAGITALGENRSEGLEKKLQDLAHLQVDWHFIGNVQSRKVRDMVNEVAYIHSLSRMSIVKEIQKRANQSVNCFVQVNVSGEDSKSGLSPEEVLPFIYQIAHYDKVRIVGLMTMAPNTEDETVIRNTFAGLRELRDKVMEEELAYAPCTELSMGMSNDYEIAIEEGATFVRIGTALVGTESGDAQ